MLESVAAVTDAAACGDHCGLGLDFFVYPVFNLKEAVNPMFFNQVLKNISLLILDQKV